jgi:thiol-disulfide isomerase/thioredoxin
LRKIIVILFLIVFLSPIESTFGQTPPKFWIRSLEGKRFDSRKEKSPYVISFFFVHCVPCIKEIPELYKFMSTNYPNVPLLFIDPIKDDSKKDIQRFSEKLNVPSSYFYKDSFGTISKKFFKGTMSFPTIVGIRGNEYLFRFNGIDKTKLDKIKSLL